MAKKKLRDCTYGEMQRHCKSKKYCCDCPLMECYQDDFCDIDLCGAECQPQRLSDKILDTEIEIPEEEK